MSNLLSYCGLVDARIRVSDKDLPVQEVFMEKSKTLTWNVCGLGGLCFAWDDGLWTLNEISIFGQIWTC